MKIAVIADAHFNVPKDFDRIEGGTSTRLNNISLAVNWCLYDAYDRKCDYVVFAGDFCGKERLSPQVATYISATIRPYLGRFDRMFLLEGNHEYFDKFHSVLDAFSGGANVTVLRNGVFDFEGGRLCMVPYTPHINDTIGGLGRQRRQVLISHFAVSGGLTDSWSGHRHEGGISPKMLKGFDLVVLGDFHKRQVIGSNINYVGAPIQHGFDEAGNETGYAIVTMGGEKRPRIDFVNTPDDKDWNIKFQIIDVNSDKIADHVRALAQERKLPGNYYWWFKCQTSKQKQLLESTLDSKLNMFKITVEGSGDIVTRLGGSLHTHGLGKLLRRYLRNVRTDLTREERKKIFRAVTRLLEE